MSPWTGDGGKCVGTGQMQRGKVIMTSFSVSSTTKLDHTHQPKEGFLPPGKTPGTF